MGVEGHQGAGDVATSAEACSCKVDGCLLVAPVVAGLVLLEGGASIEPDPDQAGRIMSYYSSV